MTGGIPSRPSQELCTLHGLDDDIWYLMEQCWSRDPTARPITADIVSSFQMLLNGSADQRPSDMFDTCSPWKVLHSVPEHPFSVLSSQEEDDAIMQAWKYVTTDEDVEHSSFSHFDVSDLQTNLAGEGNCGAVDCEDMLNAAQVLAAHTLNINRVSYSSIRMRVGQVKLYRILRGNPQFGL
jgi:hypothetical protein